MSTEQPQDLTVVLNSFTLGLMHRFRERYAQYQACQDTAESQALAKQVDDLAFKLACSLESVVERAEAEQQAAAKG